MDATATISPCEDVFKGYIIATGYMGWVPWYERYMLFETEAAYYDYVNDHRTLKGEIDESVKWNYGEKHWWLND